MQQKIVFTSGMDSDTSAEKFGEGKAAKRVDVRVLASDNNEIGAIETVLGNSVVSYGLPAGDNVVIGSKEYVKYSKVYYFVYNSSNNHTILEYNYLNDTITLVLQESAIPADYYLKFDVDHLITGINVIELDSDNHLLYWTDNYENPNDSNDYNEPKKLNIEKAKYFSAGNYTLGYPSPFEPRFITRIKQPPLFAPTYVWSNDPAQLVNHLDKRFFRFKVQFVYDDKEISAWSPISAYAWPVTTNLGGTGEDLIYADNKITIDVPTGSGIVTRIRIAAQQLGSIDFSLIADLSKEALGLTNDSTYQFPFYNDGNYVTLVATESNKLYDNVPLRSKAQELIEGSRIVDGLVTENQDPVAIDMRLPLSYVKPTAPSNIWFPNASYLKSGGIYKNGIVYYDNPGNRSGLSNIVVGKTTDVVEDRFGTTLYVPFLTDPLYNPSYYTNSGATSAVVNASAYGSGYLPGDTITLSGGTFTSPAILNVDSVQFASSSFFFSGAGYSASDVITLDGGTVVTVNSVGGFGEVVSYTVSSRGSYSGTVPAALYQTSVSPAGGASFVLTSLSFGVLSVSVNQAGLYTSAPSNPVSQDVSSGAGVGANFNVVFGSLNDQMQYVPQVNVEIYNEPPTWATHYQIVRSKDEAIASYTQFVIQDFAYLNADRTLESVPANAKYIEISLLNITDRYKTENPNSTLVYDYAVGDRVRFIANAAWTTSPTYPSTNTPPYSPAAISTLDTFFPFNDQEVIAYDSSTGILLMRMSPTTPTTLKGGALFEVYHPAASVINDNELMYEVAEEGTLGTDIHGNWVHNGSLANQLISSCTSTSYNSGTNVMVVAAPLGHGFNTNDKVKVKANTGAFSIYGVVTGTTGTSITIDTTGYTMFGTYASSVACKIIKAAEDIFNSGDCFRRYCDMPFVSTASQVCRVYSYIEASSASNLFTSNADGFGRPNTVDAQIKRVTRQSTIYYSELFIAETNINGLSSVYDSNYESYDQRYGGIYKFRVKNTGLVMMQELKLSLVPVDRIIYGDLQLNTAVGTSNAVLSPQAVPYAGEFGIGRNPESHAVFGDNDYGIDVLRGVVWRLANDGITVISDTGSMHNYFTDKCKAIVATGQKSQIYGVFDTKFNEYVIAFAQVIAGVENIIPAETLAWNERFNQWSTFYSYHPEGMCSANSGIVTFKEGRLYVHNVNPIYNKFYGILYNSEFWVYLNAVPSNVKILESISEETNSPWEVYQITTPNGQLTNLIASDFEKRENNEYAAVWRDTNTPNIIPPALPLFEGDVMRDRTMLAKFRYTGNNYNKINAVNFDYILSFLSNR
jgi:hypothetical protein